MLLPDPNPYVSGEVSLFEKLVSIGEHKESVTLPLELHAFLVACLLEHMKDVAIIQHMLALGLLGSTGIVGELGNLVLRRTGDGALLLVGLFPERARRLNVAPAYFGHMGQAAYATLATRYLASKTPERGKHYNRIVKNFSLLARVLRRARAEPSKVLWETFFQFPNGYSVRS